MANRVFVTGDTHGGNDANKIIKFAENTPLDYDDYIIICGDCGVVWSKSTLKQSIDFFDNLGATILFVDGNHENFDMLKKYKPEVWNGGKVHKISKNIYHLMRGQVFEILGKKFLTMGGASSTDKEVRTEHKNWWQDEEITYHDLLKAFDNLQKHNYCVDFVISHTQNKQAIDELVETLTACGESVPYYLQKKLQLVSSHVILEELRQKTTYEQWFSGHLHINEKLKKHTILYDEILQLI